MQQVSLSHIFHPAVNNNYSTSISTGTWLQKFAAWLNSQDEHRLLWLGVAVLCGIGTIVPLTLLSMVFCANNNFTLWIITRVVNVPVLVLNLAATPPKYTLPVLFAAWAIDVAIMAFSIAVFLMG